jgi:hypothetical protein
MPWFSDGKRLVYVKLVPRDQLPVPSLGLDVFGKYAGQSWDEVPAVYVLDIPSGTSTFLHVGWAPIVSSEGNVVLVGGWDDQMEFTWRRVTFSDRRSMPVRLPGDAGGAIAALSEDIVLYWGLPTTGCPIKYTKHNSLFHGGLKLMLTLKVALVGTNQFQTVIPEINPRSLVGFGSSPGKRFSRSHSVSGAMPTTSTSSRTRSGEAGRSSMQRARKGKQRFSSR